MKQSAQAYQWTVNEDEGGRRLDVFLVQQLPDELSRSAAKRLIEEGQVTVNGRPRKAHHPVATGDRVCVTVPPHFSRQVLPEKVTLDVFYEDAYLAVINKPAGMLVHPTENVRSETLVNALLHRFPQLSQVNADVRPGIVHRLDRETSGLMLIAKDDRTHVRLSRQFEKHRIHKRYLALVQGTVAFDEGKIDQPLGRHPRHWDKKSVSFEDGAKSAMTIYRVQRRISDRCTLVALFPQSGRTHQLRVHMSWLGHPILGDTKYAKKLGRAFPRLALHAQAIGLSHPQHGHWLELSLPPPPEFINPEIA